ncbi:MAG TPA: T9SS type A sorting domain-containing protein [Dinghuibacter sp.]|uniref:T9SS type A sorting domain-containing protein n=1 Tax=Dinghuibacter sp. TaxID=2024697 RepID=UPI002CBC5004|nr:T9SS type A sorting domain-containing protein [Dinghuibacter sp.]HTJ10384.1 T9SS type A sorting domain-containing protein [Dinghuibacter sp.]
MLRTWRSVVLLTAVLTFFAGGTIRAQGPTPLVTVREGLPDTNNAVFRQVIYGKGLFVACMKHPARLYTSRDGLQWSETASPPLGPDSVLADFFQNVSIAFGAGRWVVTSDSGRIYTSADLSTWTRAASGTTRNIGAVRYLHGLFYAVGDSATFLSSPDGLTWTKRTTGIGNPTAHFNGVYYGNGHLVVTADVPATLYDSSAGGWTADSSRLSFNFGFARGRFYLFSNDSSLVSTDLRHWSPIAVSPTAGECYDVFGDDTRVYISSFRNDTVDAVRVSASEDGIRFGPAYRTVLSEPAHGAYFNHRYFLFDGAGAGPMAVSTDGLHYAIAGSNAAYLATNGRNYVKLSVTADASYLYGSTDGASWTLAYTAPGAQGLIYDGTQFWAIGTKTYTSADGHTWTDRGASGHAFMGMSYGNGHYIAWASNGPFSETDSLFYGTDGLTWSPSAIPTYSPGPRQLPAPVPFGTALRAHFLNGEFYVIGSNGILLYSTDGSSYGTTYVGGNAPFIADIAYDADSARFYLFGVISTDVDQTPQMMPWTEILTDPTTNTYNIILDTLYGIPASVQAFNFSSVFYSHGHFISSIDNHDYPQQGYLLWSADGVHWGSSVLDRPTQFTSAVTGKDTFLLEGYYNLEVLALFASPHSRLLNFRAVAENNTRAVLSWETTSELGSQRFVVERSTETSGWDSIGVVAAAGSSDGFRHYSFTDEAPLVGADSYRLVLVNVDNSTQTSDIRHLFFDKPPVWVVYPNPFADWLVIQRSAEEGKEEPAATVMLYDAMGRLVLEKVLTGTSVRLETGRLAFGFYQLVIRETQGVVYHKELLHFW